MMNVFLTRYLMAISALVVVLLTSAAVLAAPAGPGPQGMVKGKTTSPLLQTVASTCVRLFRQRSGDVLVNNCNICVQVGVVRERRGGLAPQARKFNVQKNSSFPLPFKGPGVTRVKSKFPCPGEAGAVTNLAEQPRKKSDTDDPQACLSLSGGSRGVTLDNVCNECRIAAIERFNSRRQSLGREFRVVRAGKQLLIRPQGAAQVGLAGDALCPLAIRNGG